MILDSSAVVAIFRDEPEAEAFTAVLEAAGPVSISAATLVELSLVLGAERWALIESFLDEAHVTVVPVDRAQAAVAVDAHARFGRRSGSPARLNFGDCFSYALARSSDRPLLCKGDDFVHTDLELAT